MIGTGRNVQSPQLTEPESNHEYGSRTIVNGPIIRLVTTVSAIVPIAIAVSVTAVIAPAIMVVMASFAPSLGWDRQQRQG